MAKRRSGDGNSGNHDGHELISLLYPFQPFQFMSGHRLLFLNYITFLSGDGSHALISIRILGHERIKISLFYYSTDELTVCWFWMGILVSAFVL